MKIVVSFSPIEAIRTHNALSSSIDRMREFCRETDRKFGSMNNMYRDAIEDCKRASSELLKGLRAEGWPMIDSDVKDDPIDEKATAVAQKRVSDD